MISEAPTFHLVGKHSLHGTKEGLPLLHLIFVCLHRRVQKPTRKVKKTSARRPSLFDLAEVESAFRKRLTRMKKRGSRFVIDFLVLHVRLKT